MNRETIEITLLTLYAVFVTGLAVAAEYYGYINW